MQLPGAPQEVRGMRYSQHDSIPTHQDKEQTLTHTCTHTLAHANTRVRSVPVSIYFRAARMAGARGSPVPGGFL